MLLDDGCNMYLEYLGENVSLRVFASSGWSDGKGADGSDRAYGV